MNVEEATERIKNISLGGTGVDTVDNPDDLSPAEKQVLEQLKTLQEEHRTIEKKLEDEWVSIKLNYEKLYDTVYSKRAQVLLKNQSENTTGVNRKSTAIRGFWLKAFLNHYHLRTMIEEADKEILMYLTDVQSCWMDEGKLDSFRLIFSFAPNPFFKNRAITKQYNMEMIEGEQDPLLQNISSSDIDWYDGKNVTKMTKTRKERSKQTNTFRTVSSLEDNRKSFFSFFSNREIPTSAKLQSMGDREFIQLGADIELEYKAGVIIRDRIIPYAVKWFLGEMDDQQSEDYTDDDIDSDNDDSDTDDA